MDLSQYTNITSSPEDRRPLCRCECAGDGCSRRLLFTRENFVVVTVFLWLCKVVKHLPIFGIPELDLMIFRPLKTSRTFRRMPIRHKIFTSQLWPGIRQLCH